EAARPGRQGAESVVPALALQLGPKRVHPELERRRSLARVVAELVRRAEAQAVLELRVAFLSALREHLVQCASEVVRAETLIGPPVAIPQGPGVVAIDRLDDSRHGGAGRVVAGDGALPEVFLCGVAFVVLDEVRITFP